MPRRALIAIIEDDIILGKSLRQRFLLEGFRVAWFTTIAEARSALAGAAIDLVISDIRLPDGNGGDLMTEIFESQGALPTIFMTAFADLAEAVRLIKLGARDYVEKPFNLDQLLEKVSGLLGQSQPAESEPFFSFGLSPSTQDVRRTLEKVADLNVPVLLQGETGSGKDVAARYLHSAGQRADRPLVIVNCASFPEPLFDDALFGHEKGAFTGASGLQIGLVEEAGDGTLFFDEVAEISLALQAKLLRLVEAREYRRLGGSQLLTSDARFVFATHKNLSQAVERGEFREDLWFRINVVTIETPPLRCRRQEIPALIDHFVQRAAQTMGKVPPALEPGVLSIADTHEWRGNVRELLNRVERAVALCENGVIAVSDFWPDKMARGIETAVSPAGFSSLSQARDEAERRHILAALEQCAGSIQETATLLQISRTTLWEKMRRHGLEAGKDFQ